MAELKIELPNSPGVEVTATRGGHDPITGEVLSDRYVQFSWIDESGEMQVNGFVGPAT